jgi:superfamily II DNA or RNA helicase/HKD family nuclease
MTERLPAGLYESLLTLGLREAVTDLEAAGWTADVANIDEALLADHLADHIREAARRSIASVRGADHERPLAQVDLVNRVLATLREGGSAGSVLEDDAVASGPSVLQELRGPSPVPLEARATTRPHISLRESALLVNGHHDYQIGAEVAREIVSADRVDLLCAFVRFAGLRLVRNELDAFVRRGGQLRVIASVYTGSTEKRALDELVALGARVKVSYETDQTRLHAKAWLFERSSGFHTAYIGSSNLTQSAMVEGLEWNVRISGTDNPNIVDRVRATFEQYWNEPAFVDYSPARDGERLTAALARQRQPAPLDAAERLIGLDLDLAPQPHQVLMLEELDAERTRGHFRNLVVAATGTGKTWVSAFDYRRLRAAGFERLLFVAHRDEILVQSQLVFQLVLRDSSFGERFVGSERPVHGDHVFASVQSLHRHVDAIDPAAWDVVIVDEFHHAEAETYRRLLTRLAPKVLIGLTATPERADDRSILHWFDDRIACEVRLWQALEQGLLSPFHYFGTFDGSDLRGLSFRRGQYAVAELEATYLGDRERATRVLQAVEQYVPDPDRMRALGFCVSVAHAQFMAERFEAAGISAIALHANSPAADRKSAVGRLERGALQAIFTVDLFNEGIDIPTVDTVLLLRPTESSTVFLQQLGRGLRRAEGKSVLTVLDFIGQAHRQYRSDIRFRALIGGTRLQVTRAVEEQFPVVPPGCAVKLDRLSQEAVLANLKSTAWVGRKALTEDLRAMPAETTLAQFLDASGHDVEDVYARPAASHSFTTLQVAAHPELGPHLGQSDFDRSFGRLLHVDDDDRFDTWGGWLADATPPLRAPSNSRDGRLQMMLFTGLGQRGTPLAQIDRVFNELWGDQARRQELRELLAVLRDRARANTLPLDAQSAVPLHSHASYALYEIVSGFGVLGKDGALRETREGLLWAEDSRTHLFFITLEKSDSEYSPTTKYEDYPISPSLFHWESQSTTSADSPTGQRYINHRARKERVILFARRRKRDGRGETSPYTCLGFANLVQHESSRPMKIVWELERPMSAGFYQEAKVAAG